MRSFLQFKEDKNADLLEVMEKDELSEKDAILKRIEGLYDERIKYYKQAHTMISTEGKTCEQVSF